VGITIDEFCQLIERQVINNSSLMVFDRFVTQKVVTDRLEINAYNVCE